MTDIRKCCELFMKNPDEAGWKSVDDCVQKWENFGKNSFYKGCDCLKKGKKGNAYFECYTGTEGALLKSRTGGSKNTFFVNEIEAQLDGKSSVKYGSCMHNGACYQYEIDARIDGGRVIKLSCTQPTGKKVDTCDSPNDPNALEAVSQCKIPCHQDKYVSDMYTNTSWTVIVAIAIMTMLIVSMIAFRKPLKRALNKLTTKK